MIEIPGYHINGLLPRKNNKSIYIAKRNIDNLSCIIKTHQLTPHLDYYGDCGKLFYEIQLMHKIYHTNTIKLLDYGKTKTHVYCVMEHCKNGDLRDRIYHSETNSKPLNNRKTLLEILEGVKYLHTNKILHLDLNPTNIGFYEDDTTCIFDFGIALDIESNILRSRPGSVIGTFAYLAPELIRHSSDIDERADIYSFGCIIYEIYAKKRLFTGTSKRDILVKKMTNAPIDLTDIEQPYASLIEICAANDPNLRFDNCQSITEWLEEVGVV